MDKARNMYGTTLRVWDPSIEAWRITWINPVSSHREEQIGRRIGADIVQIGARSNGTATRWRFTEITPDSFLWIGERTACPDALPLLAQRKREGVLFMVPHNLHDQRLARLMARAQIRDQ